MRRFLGWFLALAALLLGAALPWLAAALAPEGTRPAWAAAPTAETGHPLVALTFDDGPRRSTTVRLLDGLKERGVQATFFLIGGQVPGCEDIVKRMGEEGHQLGVHTYDHVRLTQLNTADFSAQVDRTRSLLEETAGPGEYLLRPPYGEIDPGVTRRAGSAVILWSVDPEDWRDRDAARVVGHIADTVKDGDVILLHDIYPASVDAALAVVDALHERGFLFVTVDELARQRGVELEAGKVYRSFYP